MLYSTFRSRLLSSTKTECFDPEVSETGNTTTATKSLANHYSSQMLTSYPCFPMCARKIRKAWSNW